MGQSPAPLDPTGWVVMLAVVLSVVLAVGFGMVAVWVAGRAFVAWVFGDGTDPDDLAILERREP